MRRLGILVACVLVVIPAKAQEARCSYRDVYVQVRTHDGRPATRIEPSALTAKIQGKSAAIVSVQPVKEIRAVFLLDASGSMNYEAPHWSAALNVVRVLANALPTNTQIAFAARSLKMSRSLPVSLDTRAKLDEELAALNINAYQKDNRTALWDWVSDAIDLFEHTKPGDTVFLISDGGDNASKRRYEDVEKQLAVAGVRLNTIIIPPLPNNSARWPDTWETPEEEEGARQLQRLAISSGGTAVFVQTTKQNEYARTLNTLATDFGWVLRIRDEHSVKRWASWKLEVVDQEGRTLHGVDTKFPRLWPPCIQ